MSRLLLVSVGSVNSVTHQHFQSQRVPAVPLLFGGWVQVLQKAFSFLYPRVGESALPLLLCPCLSCHILCGLFSLFVQKVFIQATVPPRDKLLCVDLVCTWEVISGSPCATISDPWIYSFPLFSLSVFQYSVFQVTSASSICCSFPLLYFYFIFCVHQDFLFIFSLY